MRMESSDSKVKESQARIFMLASEVVQFLSGRPQIIRTISAIPPYEVVSMS